MGIILDHGCSMAMTAVIGAGKEQRNITNYALPFLFFVLHISYGIGTLAGLIKMPRWRKGIENGKEYISGRRMESY